jgi:hypothetical protein
MMRFEEVPTFMLAGYETSRHLSFAVRLRYLLICNLQRRRRLGCLRSRVSPRSLR